jgi:hypothetical protein
VAWAAAEIGVAVRFHAHATIDRVFRFLPFFILCMALPAVAPVDSAAKTAIESALDMARATPGEFAADALLRIASLSSLDGAQRAKLIEEAFHRADEAQQPYKRRNAMPNIASNVQFQERAFAQDLDALSLRTRAVEEMLPIDAAKARQLFLDMPPLDLPRVSCEDVMVFEVSSYYQALNHVALRSFTAKEIRNGDAARLVAQRIARISSSAEIEPAARAIAGSGLDDAQFAGALGAFTEALKKISKDDRSFTFYLPDAGAAVQSLIADITHRRLSPLPLIEAYRLYLVANFTAARCADDDVMAGSATAADDQMDSRSVEAIRFFNQSVRAAPLQPIQFTEAVARVKAGVATGLRSCAGEPCASIARRYRALIFSSEGAPMPNSARDSTEWRGRFEQFLNELGEWRDNAPDAAGEDAAQQFREKCAFYLELPALPRDERLRRMALVALLEYLEHSLNYARTRIEWLLPANLQIGRMGIDPAGIGKFAELFRRSSDPVIAMYAQLEAAAPRSAAAVFALM